MTAIEPSLNVAVWNTKRKLTFAATEDLSAWLDEELELWRRIKAPTTGRLPKVLTQQLSGLAAINSAYSAGDRAQLDAAMRAISSGTVLTSDSGYFPAISDVGESDGDSAALLMLAARSDSAAQLSAFGLPPPQDAVFRLIASLLRASKVGTKSASQNHLDAILRTKSEAEDALATLRESFERQERDFSALKSEIATLRDGQRVDWGEQLEAVKTDWSKLKTVYDTELGLRAPTSYWTDRARQHKWQALIYGAAFGVSIVVLMSLFLISGVSYLEAASADRATMALVLPVLIPAFGGVWILKILGRLLSESVHLMRDASERETLVKTFLALMKDESTGKSVVKDEDRILILHSLFRSSTGSAADDAPPVHWFDVLASKIGSKQR